MSSAIVYQRPLTAEQTVALALLRRESSDQMLAGPVAADLTKLTELFARHRLLGLFGPRLCEILPAGPSRDLVAAHVAAHREFVAPRAFYQQTLTWRLTQALNAADVRVMPLKGPFLVERLHGDASLRLSADIDLLVTPRDLPGAIDAIEQVGYHRPRISVDMPLLHHIFEAEGAPDVELHWRISWYETTYAATVLDRAQEMSGVMQPAPEDDLISLLVFYARDGLTGLRTLADLVAWWEQWGDSDVIDRARRIVREHPGLERPVAAAALTAERVTGFSFARLVTPAACQRSATAAAVALRDPFGVRPESTQWVVKVVDGCLAGPTALSGWISRAAFPRFQDSARHTRFRRGCLYLMAFTTHTLMIWLELIRSRPWGTPTHEAPTLHRSKGASTYAARRDVSAE